MRERKAQDVRFDAEDDAERKQSKYRLTVCRETRANGPPGEMTARADPELLKLTNSEKFVEELNTSADDYGNDGLTELELCAQYCRTCTVSVQRLFHVRSIGEVCKRSMSAGDVPFPLDLVEDLAQDDDSEVSAVG